MGVRLNPKYRLPQYTNPYQRSICYETVYGVPCPEVRIYHSQNVRGCRRREAQGLDHGRGCRTNRTQLRQSATGEGLFHSAGTVHSETASHQMLSCPHRPSWKSRAPSPTASARSSASPIDPLPGTKPTGVIVNEIMNRMGICSAGLRPGSGTGGGSSDCTVLQRHPLGAPRQNGLQSMRSPKTERTRRSCTPKVSSWARAAPISSTSRGEPGDQKKMPKTIRSF